MLCANPGEVFPDASLNHFPPAPDRKKLAHPSICAKSKGGTVLERVAGAFRREIPGCGGAVGKGWCCVWSQKMRFKTTAWKMQNTLLPFLYHRIKPLFVSDIHEGLLKLSVCGGGSCHPDSGWTPPPGCWEHGVSTSRISALFEVCLYPSEELPRQQGMQPKASPQLRLLFWFFHGARSLSPPQLCRLPSLAAGLAAQKRWGVGPSEGPLAALGSWGGPRVILWGLPLGVRLGQHCQHRHTCCLWPLALVCFPFSMREHGLPSCRSAMLFINSHSICKVPYMIKKRPLVMVMWLESRACALDVLYKQLATSGLILSPLPSAGDPWQTPDKCMRQEAPHCQRHVCGQAAWACSTAACPRAKSEFCRSRSAQFVNTWLLLSSMRRIILGTGRRGAGLAAPARAWHLPQQESSTQPSSRSPMAAARGGGLVGRIRGREREISWVSFQKKAFFFLWLSGWLMWIGKYCWPI